MILDPQLVASGEYNRFYKSVQFVLEHEGGYINDPADPGGETNFGISKRFHPDLDIKNLSPEAAANIYYQEYWVPSGACSLDYPNCVAVLDTSVNLGVSACLRLIPNPFDIDVFIANRKQFYANAVKQNPASQKYLAGWLNRVSDLQKLIQQVGNAG